ncbi:helicase protein [Dictyocaulus viviparus]|uniref:RNA helicase n=1 Tax=Dictyocaulus viviparus TaxID=29172 RepID=A0A0D8Y2C1_DICVI|nr:helicase protein [Dictyocaulus viviparus]
MAAQSDVIYDPNVHQPNSDDANQLVMIPKKKRKLEDKDKLTKKKDPTGGKKNRNFVKEKEKQKLTKKMKRKLLAQEELFANLAEYQLDSKKLSQLLSSSHMQDKPSGTRNDDRNFPAKLKVCSSKTVLPQLFHEKPMQQNYYPTDDESTDEEIVGSKCEEICEIEPEHSTCVASPSTLNSVPELETTGCLNDGVEKCSGKKSHENISEQETRNDGLNNIVDDSVSPGVKRERILIARDPAVEAKRSQLPIYSEEVPIMEIFEILVVFFERLVIFFYFSRQLLFVVKRDLGKLHKSLSFFTKQGSYANNGQLIGITEPRRVAAISMSERVGIELGVPDEVSYQVRILFFGLRRICVINIRYEGNRSDKTRILFMTDGVLMKEMESDVMLKKYSAILIDEAHERSMYSDVLIGMLSRIAPLRAKTPSPLKLIIMSATLRLEDFTHKRLFPTLEPRVLHVKARQFPVTVHFERRTPDDYLAAVFRKVCRIHEVLPGGGILVFVSGQKEVCYLVKKLAARYPSIHKFDSKDLFESGVEDSLLDDYEDLELNHNLNTFTSLPPNDCPPLYCLPLYSLLSSEKQRRVFLPPPDGARMCVIATNVAETSVTISGIKYVVDSGYEKRRIYDPITGVSQFIIARVSKASADQRAGRAGRTAAGHAYRLYSSALFQTFEEYSRPEILNKPPDQLVLHLKSMNIVKVVNFPFPSTPDTDALEAAEKRLIKLGALEVTKRSGKTVARITPLGRTLSMFPLAPSYAKVIAIANQHELMPHAILLIAALSVREPLIPVSSIRCESIEETKEKMTELLRIRRGWCGEGPSRRLGDLLVLMKAVGFSEAEKMDPSVCSKHGLRHKAMIEIRKLRTQITNIVNTSFKQPLDIVMDPCLPPPSDVQAQLLRQIMVAGLVDNIARRVDRSCNDEDVPKGAYQTMKLQGFVFIDPASVLYTDEPDYVIYQQVIQIKDRICMQNLMMVDHEWLSRLAESYCNFASMDSEQTARYDPVKDQIVKRVEVTFGPLEWRLDPVDRPVPNDIMLYRLFAQFLLAGEVMPKLAEYVPKMLAPPTTMVRSWAKLQRRTEILLNALVAKDIHTKASLVDEWYRNENYLLEEYLEWLPESLHSQVTIMWPPLDQKKSGMGRNKIYVELQ